MYGRKVRVHRGCKRRLRRIFSRGLEPKSGLRGVVWMGIKPKSGPWGHFLFAVYPTCLSPNLSYIKQYTNYLPSHSHLHLANLYPVSQPTSRFIQNSQLPTESHLRFHSKAQNCSSIIHRVVIKTINHLYFNLLITIKSYFELHDCAFDPIQKHFHVTC